MAIDTQEAASSFISQLHGLVGGVLSMVEGMVAAQPGLAGITQQLKRLQSQHASLGTMLESAAETVVEDVVHGAAAVEANPPPPPPPPPPEEPAVGEPHPSEPPSAA